jgi:hypothetical protein
LCTFSHDLSGMALVMCIPDHASNSLDLGTNTLDHYIVPLKNAASKPLLPLSAGGTYAH